MNKLTPAAVATKITDFNDIENRKQIGNLNSFVVLTNIGPCQDREWTEIVFFTVWESIFFSNHYNSSLDYLQVFMRELTYE